LTLDGLTLGFLQQNKLCLKLIEVKLWKISMKLCFT